MPGAYAHITLVNIMKETPRLEAIPSFPIAAIPAVLDYFKFCELGAVSPDYPYLALGDKDSAKWADAMHYTRSGQMIHAGIRHLRTMQGETQNKGLAWLLGYSAHVTTDVTIHPVVELKVGSYKGHEKAHRICEMHQDAHIFSRLNLGEIGLSEHLDTGISACCEPANKEKMDHDIARLWDKMLQDVHSAEYQLNRPDIHKWHKGFRFVVDKIGEEGNKLLPFARHVAVGLGLTYPVRDEIDKQFVEKLQVPNGRLHYDELFDNAIKNVGIIWQMVASGVIKGDENFAGKISAWNLDTGRDEKDKLVFWS